MKGGATLSNHDSQAQQASSSNKVPISGLMAKPKRRVRNFLLMPLVQVKLGLYSILLTILFSATVAGILYVNLKKFAVIVLQLTDVQEEVTELLDSYMSDTRWYLGLAIATFIAISVVVSILYTHRLIGPTIAFRRHVRALADGRYNVRTFLRKGDAFSELADELNHLSKVLDRQDVSKGPKEKQL